MNRRIGSIIALIGSAAYLVNMIVNYISTVADEEISPFLKTEYHVSQILYMVFLSSLIVYFISNLIHCSSVRR